MATPKEIAVALIKQKEPTSPKHSVHPIASHVTSNITSEVHSPAFKEDSEILLRSPSSQLLRDETLASMSKTREQMNKLFEKIQESVPAAKKLEPITFVNQLRVPNSNKKVLDPKSNPVLVNKINTQKQYDFDKNLLTGGSRLPGDQHKRNVTNFFS